MFKRIMFLLFTLLCINLTGNEVKAQSPKSNNALLIHKSYTGKSIKVDDGDTFLWLSKNNKSYKIRLDGIDAPEKGMAYAKASKNYLVQLLKDKKVTITITGFDAYQRVLAKVSVQGLDVNLAMIDAGYAWYFKKYNTNSIYATAEIKARQKGLGFWQDKHALAPWHVRAYRRAGYSDLEFQKLRKQNSPLIQKYLQ